MARRTIVVVGGALGGAAAALAARETDEGARIVLVERSGHVSYASAGLAYSVSGEAVSPEALRRRGAEFFQDVHRVEVRTGVVAEALEASLRTVRLSDGPLEYTSLVFAGGAQSLVPAEGLAGAANVVSFRTIEDLEEVQEAAGRGARRVAVVGPGASAVEAADAFRRAGHEVALVSGSAGLLPTFSAEPARAAAEALAAAGVRVAAGALVEAVRDGGRVRALRLEGTPEVPSDLVVLAGAGQPNTGLLARAGAALHEDGSVKVDERAATSLPHVFACGQCVAVPHAVSGWPVWPLQPAAADKTARVAGAVAAGGRAQLSAVLDTVIVRAGETVVARTGLTREEAAAWAGAEAAAIAVHGSSCERFLSSARPLSLDAIYHRGNGRLLGLEAWGGAGVDKRIDVASAAILGGLTVEQMALLDLAYAPPFSTARDVLNLAGAEAAAERAGLARPWTPREVAEAGLRVTVVDVEPERGRLRADGHVLPFAGLRAGLAGLPRGRPLVFVCHTGRLGLLAARIARQAGHRDAGYLAGGLLSWRASGLADAGSGPMAE